jgi:hypothetical protein
MEYTAHLHYRRLPYNGNYARHVMAGKGERAALRSRDDAETEGSAQVASMVG